MLSVQFCRGRIGQLSIYDSLCQALIRMFYLSLFGNYYGIMKNTLSVYLAVFFFDLDLMPVSLLAGVVGVTL